MADDLEMPPLEFADDNALTGFRLQRLEVYNWGTFHGRVWSLHPKGRNSLLTGDIGSGKSTLVDAITTLLVPANRIAFNKAAGAEFKERSLRSYVLGYHRTERGENGVGAAKPVGLRDQNSFSVLLAVFHNSGYEQTISLACVLWMKDERRQLENASDILRQLNDRLRVVKNAITEGEGSQTEEGKRFGAIEYRIKNTKALLDGTKELLQRTDVVALGQRATRLEAIRREALGDHVLTIEGCDAREREVREWLQARIDSRDRAIANVRDRLIGHMGDFCREFEAETREIDPSVESAEEFRALLSGLRNDDLPRFEARFKELLNQNTIREIANFNAHLNQERETIRERVERINQSLAEITYNPGRYIVLEATPVPDQDIRSFQSELRACTEGALTGSEDEQYSEAKFLQVKGIIERFRGREGTTELDRRWTRKVTDVRNWFAFAASERWKEDNSEHEHYSDSGGKSGGQKEKLAYTILAASLAYQFGLEWGRVKSRSFRFVVIDEAFGRGSDESAQYGLRLFEKLNLQLLIVTPLQKIHIIEPFVASVGFVHNVEGRDSQLRNLTIEAYREEKARS